MGRSSLRIGGCVQRDIKFCQQCGGALGQKEVENKLRPYCVKCDFTVFLDPKIAAVVLATKDGRLVMVRRGVEPEIGRWSFPAGYVDRGEVVEDAAIREVREETGLEVQLNGFVGLYSEANRAVVLAVYSAEIVGGSLRAGHDAQEVAYFSSDELPPLPFPHDDRIMEDWQALVRKRELS